MVVCDFTTGHDNVNNPSHYLGRHGMASIDVLRNFMSPEELRGFYLGNSLKYLLRHSKKNGLEDLKKARKNLDWLIEMEEHDENEGITVVYGADQAVYSFSQRAIEQRMER